MSHTIAKNTLSLEKYKAEMTEIYKTSVNESMLDEAPMAYKSLDDIINVIRDPVDIIDIMKPLYKLRHKLNAVLS